MSGLFDEFVADYGSGDPYVSDAYYGPQSDVMIKGAANTPPVVSDTPEVSSYSLRDILGTIGTTARDLGTAVGSIRKTVKDAPVQYRAAQTAAVQEKPLKQWWMYATTQDKLVIGLAVLGIIVVMVKR